MSTAKKAMLAWNEIDNMRKYMQGVDLQHALTAVVYDNDQNSYRLHGKLQDFLKFVQTDDFQIFYNSSIMERIWKNIITDDGQQALAPFHLSYLALTDPDRGHLIKDQLFINISLNAIYITVDECRHTQIVLGPQSICYFERQTLHSAYHIFHLTKLGQAWTRLDEQHMILVNMQQKGRTFLHNEKSLKLAAQGQGVNFAILPQGEQQISVLDDQPFNLWMISKNRPAAQIMTQATPMTIYIKSSKQHTSYVEKYHFISPHTGKKFMNYQDVKYYNYTVNAIDGVNEVEIDDVDGLNHNNLFMNDDYHYVSPIDACTTFNPEVKCGTLITRLKLDTQVKDLAAADCWQVEPTLTIIGENTVYFAQELALALQTQLDTKVIFDQPYSRQFKLKLPNVRVHQPETMLNIIPIADEAISVLDLDQLHTALNPLWHIIDQVVQVIRCFAKRNHERIIENFPVDMHLRALGEEFCQYMDALHDSCQPADQQTYRAMQPIYQQFLAHAFEIHAQNE